jgi:hypothetical protein
MLIFPVHASRIGIMGGLGPYWVNDEVSWGYALTGFADISIQNFEISPMLGFWSGIIAGERLVDVTPSIAFKYPFGARDAKFRPYIGFAPMLHFWWAQGQYDMHLGADAFAGVAVRLSGNIQIPLQVNYGFIFVEGRTVNKVTVKIGASTSM